jgi:hypothetical protein
VNVQVIADPAGRLVWASPTLSGARHDMGAAREHGVIDAIADAGVRAVADPAYQGGGPAIRVPQRRRVDPDTGRYRRLSQHRKDINTAHAQQRGPGERANAEIKNWKVSARSAPAPAAQPPSSKPSRRSSLPADHRLEKAHYLVPSGRISVGGVPFAFT